jgi:hypothetical protein
MQEDSQEIMSKNYSRSNSQGKLFKKGEDIMLTLRHFKEKDLVNRKLDALVTQNTIKMFQRAQNQRP